MLLLTKLLSLKKEDKNVCNKQVRLCQRTYSMTWMDALLFETRTVFPFLIFPYLVAIYLPCLWIVIKILLK